MLPFFVKVHGAIAKRLCTGLQIRLAQFDSGSRLQNLAVTVHAVAAFFSPAHSAHSLHTFNAVGHMRQGCATRPSLSDGVGRVCR
jgi:hypothetical protein